MSEEDKKTRALKAASDMLGVCVDVICSRAEVGVLSALSLVNQMSLSLMARIDAQSAADFGGAVADAMRAESAAAEKEAQERQRVALEALDSRAKKMAETPWGSA